MTNPPALIGSSAEFEPLAARLAQAPRLALDTEFLRERTYHAELALIQIADENDIVLFDPLAALDGAALAALVNQPAQIKVLHAARQDVEVLLPLTVTPIGPLLDTQVAAGLAGYAPQIGYGELVARELGVTLEKGQARTDWTRRPLSPAQLQYAADDVRYLLPLAERLESRLAELGRSAWLAEDLAELADPSLYRVDPLDAWQRFKNIESLPPREQLRLRALAEWRESRAIRRNLPRGWVLADDAARAIAQANPHTTDDLRRLNVLPPGTVDKLGAEIQAALATAATASPEGIVQRLDVRPDAAERERQKRLAEAVKAVAGTLELAPEVLATQKDLRRIVRGEAVSAVITGWRGEVLGAALNAALA